MAFKRAPLSHESSLPQTREIRLINGLLEPEEAKFLHKDFTELNFIPYPGVKSQIIDLNNFLDQLESKNRIKSSQTVQKLAHIANKRVIGLSHIVVDHQLNISGLPEHRDGGLPHLGFFIVAEGQVEYHFSSKRRRGLRSERLDRHEIARPGGALVVNNLLPFKELRPLHKSTNGSGARVGMRFLAHS